MYTQIHKETLTEV